MTKIYLPLRSNIGWSQSKDMRDALARRVKETLLLYDEIVIEDGTFVADVTDAGGFYPYFPPGAISSEHRLIEEKRDIVNTKITIAAKTNGSDEPARPIISGNTIARYKIDGRNITCRSLCSMDQAVL